MKDFSLRTIVALLEDGIIVVSGPALAISGIIAGVDVVTGGNILKSIAWLALAWAITLLLTLDFQVLALGVRAHRVYTSQKPLGQKIIEITLAVIIAAAISYVSIQMQSIIARVNAENVPLDLAAAQLGINTIALIWERSTLVLVLIFMSGWLRDHDSAAGMTPAQPPISDEAVQQILTKLAKLDALEQAISKQPSVITEEPLTPLLPPGEETRGEHAQDNADPLSERTMGEQQTVSFGDQIEALLKDHPTLTIRELASQVGCSLSTANKWVQRLKVPSK